MCRLEPFPFRWNRDGSSFILTRFLDANRFPPTDQVRGHASLENALLVSWIAAFCQRQLFTSP